MIDARLAELADLHGINLAYYDIYGNQREASPETIRALLASMGVATATADEIETALARTHSERWNVLLSPVIVMRLGAAASVRIRLPAALYGRTLTWRIVEEQGKAADANFDTRALPVVEAVTLDAQEIRAVELALPTALPLGYHRYFLYGGMKLLAESSLIVVPQRCYEPPSLAQGDRLWGAALQLYALRSERNWGIGDYTDLRTGVEQWTQRGAALIGTNPLHALFMHNPLHVSPYSPSSRIYTNPLYLDVQAIDDFREAAAARESAGSPEFLLRLKHLRDTEFVDYAGVAAAKNAILEMLYTNFREHHLIGLTRRGRAFRAFCKMHGEALQRYALFEALQEHFHREDPSVGGWQQWPPEYRDPSSPQVAAFAFKHAERLGFFQYLQWQAELQLTRLEDRCYELGMSIGLYTDLAISVDRNGAEAWAHQEVYALTASAGAPPDEFNVLGQDWGLPPYVPARLRAAAYAPVIATLRANMAHSGALRIDHVMGLARLYWVPCGMSAADGAYVRYPFDDLLGIVALESVRHHCLVIGEDLGTVPPEVRDALHASGVLSYRLLIFERDGGGRFQPPAHYPRPALVACSTHDLPPLGGYWQGHDLSTRAELKLFPSVELHDAQVLTRAQDRAGLLLALEHEGLLPEGASADRAAMPTMTPELALALHLFIARSPAAIMIAQLEDLMGVVEQANLPGTIDQYPNWRRKLPVTLESWGGDPRFRRYTDAISQVRGARHTPRQRRARRLQALRVPRATYRLQLNSAFTFRDATELIPYLARLGVSHVYCSPYLRARSGSTHGYDIIDHRSLNPDIGSPQDFERFTTALAEHGMGQVADVVPNHMGVLGADNAWWLDVLENGPASVYADFFDIDWQSATPELVNRVLVPVLGDHYGVVLAKGELQLDFDAGAGAFSVRYHEHRFPIDPRLYTRILEDAVATLDINALNADTAAEIRSLVSAFGYLPSRDERSAERVAERNSNKEVHKKRLAQLAAAHPPWMDALGRALRGFNGQTANFDALHELLEQQGYRLAHWRVATDEINYRRFFDINDLAALCMENEVVFEATHRLIFELLLTGKVDALRIDHPDGLRDPATYFRRLQDRYRQLVHTGDENGAEFEALYIVVEKILAPFEKLPATWAVSGTTGYRFANLVMGLFVDTDAQTKFTRLYQAFIGDPDTFGEIANRSKRLILRTALASELTVLANQLARIARSDKYTRDYTLNSLREALVEVIAAFPVYRTYVAQEVSTDDRRYIEWAIGRARRHSLAPESSSIFDFIKAVLLCELAPDSDAARALMVRNFAQKFQQVSAPVTAKGIEDTSFYIYNRLVSLNDVGGDPATFGYTVNAFHGAMVEDAARWPHTMLATSTHDNKRSEDVRARINVISEMPGMWRLNLRRWSRMNRSKKRMLDDAPAPTRNDEYLLYQTLLGSFPLPGAERPDAAALAAYCERIESYMLKAIREAKVNTSWVNANEEYEAATVHFVRGLLSAERNLFLDDFYAALRPLAWLGLLNSLQAVLIKLTAPGVPDFYQGAELWDFSLVDPDNRRPVDYLRRAALLKELRDGWSEDNATPLMSAMLAQLEDGRAKLFLISRVLTLRREHSELFLHGDYTPLVAAGAQAGHIVSYARRYQEQGVVVIAGRLFSLLGVTEHALPCDDATWGDTRVELPFLDEGTTLCDAISGMSFSVHSGSIAVADAWARFPGAVLVYSNERE